MLDWQPLVHGAPNKPAFIPLDREQIALHLDFGLLARLMRQCGGIIGFSVYLCIEPLNQRITMQPCEQCDRIMRLSEPKCQMIAATHF